MVYTCKYKSSIGDILLATDEIGLIGLWFEGQKYFANTLPDEHIPQETEILTETIKWLDMYFSGEEPNFTPPLHPSGSSFRQAVWQILLQIPYGQTITYGEIARKIAETKNTSRMSAQAVGGAVGHNEISIIIPCHRVVGTNGSLTGYAGGIDKKISLLELEQKKLEAENSEIVDIVRGMSIPLAELPLLFEKLKGGGALGQSVPKSDDEEKEEN